MILLFVIVIGIIALLIWREVRIRSVWFHYAFWHELTTGQTMCRHRCGLCHRWLSDIGGGFFQDYTCPCGNYEFHFDSGQFRCRVGQQWIEFRDDPRNKAQVQNGLAQIKTACEHFH